MLLRAVFYDIRLFPNFCQYTSGSAWNISFLLLIRLWEAKPRKNTDQCWGDFSDLSESGRLVHKSSFYRQLELESTYAPKYRSVGYSGE